MKRLFPSYLLPAFFSMTAISIAAVSCSEKRAPTNEKSDMIQLITLDPGHFHAALVQKKMYKGVDSTVHVYSPGGSDLRLHLDRIDAYNNRQEEPTRWKENVYEGKDFLEKMIAEKKGNVVVLSGNNQKKTDYILSSLNAGFHVFADKPMAINRSDFETLKQAFDTAEKKELLLYDIMTERFEITTILQRELSQIPEIFGSLEKGSVANPAITKESVHYFYKQVSGNTLIRPAWFMDVTQQGEGIADVMTHLVDLVQWECFPEQVIRYEQDINIQNARRWATPMTLAEFTAITGINSFPAYLQKDVQPDSSLQIYCNGEINYTLKGVHARTSVTWNYKAPEGTGDTHFSVMRGTRANLVIRQGKEEQFKPVLYIEPVSNDPAFESDLEKHFVQLNSRYPGLTLYRTPKGWGVKIPAAFAEGHEAHFARVTEKFLEYLKNGNIPEWEKQGMLAKYYTTTRALEYAQNNRP